MTTAVAGTCRIQDGSARQDQCLRIRAPRVYAPHGVVRRPADATALCPAAAPRRRHAAMPITDSSRL